MKNFCLKHDSWIGQQLFIKYKRKLPKFQVTSGGEFNLFFLSFKNSYDVLCSLVSVRTNEV